MQLHEPYRARSISHLGNWNVEGWRVKAYGIACETDRPREHLVHAARRLTGECLRAVTGSHYGVGFVGIHEGRGSNIVFVDWWAEENELHHQVFVAPEDSAEFRPMPAAGMTGCVWDLAVIGFERDAWVGTVLANPDGPDLDAYLARHFSGRV